MTLISVSSCWNSLRAMVLMSNCTSMERQEEIMIEVWGESNYYNGRSLDVFISKLRSYLKPDPNLSIKTIPTVGYILEESLTSQST